MCSLILFSPFALKKIDTQLATLTVIFFFEPGWGEEGKKYMDCFVLFPCCTWTNIVVIKVG